MKLKYFYNFYNLVEQKITNNLNLQKSYNVFLDVNFFLDFK